MFKLETVRVESPMPYMMKALVSPLGRRYRPVGAFRVLYVNRTLRALEGMPVGAEQMLEKGHAVLVHGCTLAQRRSP